ncbi:MAG: SDR family NAD(P)-dependent oxidoreductase [Gammaproteobacteria bacterium]|jgi:NAD(P)-dependent dehydrogenase (short-subunit alcohol dehydrogenase family)|nr:SDR family NAD(P)-dependent oxidoreductase [Gammaproteobacteria bacterium]MBK6582116.1 SDR family NAD(P)-dependent oxidoreductase [Gammaproteobacteria bacterium]MBK7729384.1 SDR family NAD(P)-dependent oxidoreductase [Gammaproteobacteria bacterium]MBK9668251.1 SDR family NAD(P)-dependent oxidoreductase [Gammaproteobacteria bacterium]
MTLEGKRIVITGANGALGRGVTRCARALGAETVLLDLDFAANAGAGESRAIRVDLGDEAATRTCFGQIGAVDALFNLAGGFAMGPCTWEVDAAGWSRMFAINVDTMRNAVRAVLPGMLARGRGAIVNVGALGALQGQGRMSAYCAAKSVVMRLTESLAAELKEQGVNVNAVLPSMLDTPRNRADMPEADFSRWVSPEDLGNVICFLGSDSARAIHGALIPVSGLV